VGDERELSSEYPPLARESQISAFDIRKGDILSTGDFASVLA
jgi:hypothetical protein